MTIAFVNTFLFPWGQSTLIPNIVDSHSYAITLVLSGHVFPRMSAYLWHSPSPSWFFPTSVLTWFFWGFCFFAFDVSAQKWDESALLYLNLVRKT